MTSLLLPAGLGAQSLNLYPFGAANADYDRLSDSDELTSCTNASLTDTDGDLISDSDELLITGTDPLLADSDFNSTTDYEDWLTLHPTLWDANKNGMLDVDVWGVHDPEAQGDHSPFGYGAIWWMTAHLTDLDQDYISDREEILFGDFARYNYNRAYVDWPNGEGETYDTEAWEGPEHWVPTDYDKDGLDAATEVTLGTDPYDPDTDDDGLRDGIDYYFANPLLVDTNSNGVNDHDELMYYAYAGPYFADEWALDTAIENALGSSPLGGLDWDRDGMSNIWEMASGLNPADALDAYDDPDGDFLTNLEEYRVRTDPHLALSPVSQSVMVVDIDPMTELPVTRAAVNDTEAVTALPLLAGLVRDNGPMSGFEYEDDWDGDTFDNMLELQTMRNPRVVDILDVDGDSLPTWWEILVGLDETNADEDADGVLDGADDFDDDGLANRYEFNYGTDPLVADTDGDGLPDGWETSMGLDPLSAVGAHGASGDPDNDGVTNLGEFQSGNAANQATNPPGFEVLIWQGLYGATLLRHDYKNARKYNGDPLPDPGASYYYQSTSTLIYTPEGDRLVVEDYPGWQPGTGPSISSLLETVDTPAMQLDLPAIQLGYDIYYHEYHSGVDGFNQPATMEPRWDRAVTYRAAKRAVIQLTSNVPLPAGYKVTMHPLITSEDVNGNRTHVLKPPMLLEIPHGESESDVMAPYDSLNVGPIAPDDGRVDVLLLGVNIEVQRGNVPAVDTPPFMSQDGVVKDVVAVWDVDDSPRAANRKMDWIKVRVEIPGLPPASQLTLPSQWITWSIPGHSPPAPNSFETPELRWPGSFGVKRIQVNVGGKAYFVNVDVPNVGVLSETDWSAMMAQLPGGTVGAANAWANAQIADSWATSQTQFSEGQRNALEHSYWISLCSSDPLCGSAMAILLGYAHEHGNKAGGISTPFESTMDIRNNLVGASVNHPFDLTGTTIRSELMAKIANGTLWVWDHPLGQFSGFRGVKRANGQPIYLQP